MDQSPNETRMMKAIEMNRRIDVHSLSVAWLEREVKQLKEAQFRANAKEAKELKGQLRVLNNRLAMESRILDGFLDEYKRLNPSL